MAVWLLGGGVIAVFLAVLGFGTMGMPGDGGIENSFVAVCAGFAHAVFVLLLFPLGLLADPLRLPETLPVMGAIILADSAIWLLILWGIVKCVGKIMCQHGVAPYRR